MHEKFHYKTLDEIKQTAAALGVSLPFAADTHVLAEPLRVGTHVFRTGSVSRRWRARIP